MSGCRRDDAIQEAQGLPAHPECCRNRGCVIAGFPQNCTCNCHRPARRGPGSPSLRPTVLGLQHTIDGLHLRIRNLEEKERLLRTNLASTCAGLVAVKQLVPPAQWGNNLDAILRHAEDALR